MKNLDKNLGSKLAGNTLRPNKLENKGNPINDFDCYIDTLDGEECIVEFTNVYTFRNQDSVSAWEKSKRDPHNGKKLSTFINKTELYGFSDIDALLESVERAHKNKNSKKYMERDEKKILVLEISGAMIGMVFTFSYRNGNMPGNYLNFLQDVRERLDESNKFDEIIFRTYPGQIKEELYSLASFNCKDDILFSSKNGTNIKPGGKLL